MKQISIILNIVLLIAVAVLYYLHFSGSKSSTQTGETVPKHIPSFEGAVKIAYLNSDSLLKNYEFYNDIRDMSVQRQQDLEGKLNQRMSAFEKKRVEFEQNYQKGFLTSRQVQETQQQLVEEQENIMKLKDSYSMQMMENEQVMTKQLFDSITSFLNDFNKQYGYTFIMSNSGALLYSDTTLNITEFVIDGLNSRYTGSDKKVDKDKEDK